ncbi:MAG: hypothetical protein ACLPX5_07290 [Dissulfurispiraceae bacterium]
MKKTVGILLVLIVVLGFAVLASAAHNGGCGIPTEFCFKQYYSGCGIGDCTDTFKVVVDQPSKSECNNAGVVGSWWINGDSSLVPMTGTLQAFAEDDPPVLMLTGSFICPEEPGAGECSAGDLVTCSVYVAFDDTTLSSGTYWDVCMDQAANHFYDDGLTLTGSVDCSTLTHNP